MPPGLLRLVLHDLRWSVGAETITAHTSHSGTLLHGLFRERVDGTMEHRNWVIPLQIAPSPVSDTSLTSEVLNDMLRAFHDPDDEVISRPPTVPNDARMAEAVQFGRALTRDEIASLERASNYPIRYIEPTPTAVGHWYHMNMDADGRMRPLIDTRDYDIEALRNDPRFGKVEKKPGKEITIIDKTNG